MHAVFNEAVAAMRFAPNGKEDAPKTSWPLRVDGVSLRIALVSTSEQEGYVGYAKALFVTDAGFDLELLNASTQGYGCNSRIDILGRLEVRSALHLRGLSVEQCTRSIKSFAFVASQVANDARAKIDARLYSLPVPPGIEAPKVVLDEARIHRYIATQDLAILVDYWGLTTEDGFSGSGASYWYPYQAEGTQLTIRQERASLNGEERSALIEVAAVTVQLVAPKDGDRAAQIKVGLAGWEVTEGPIHDDWTLLTARKRFSFVEGASLHAFKEFLITAAREVRAVERSSGRRAHPQPLGSAGGSRH